MKKILSEWEIIEAIRLQYEIDPQQLVTLASTRKRGAPAPEYSATVDDLPLFKEADASASKGVEAPKARLG